MAQLQPLHQQPQSQMCVQPAPTGQATYSPNIPYHIYQNVVLAALNSGSHEKQAAVSAPNVILDNSHIKTEQDQHLSDLCDLKPAFSSTVVTGNDLIPLTTPALKSVFTVSSANNAALLTPQVLTQQPGNQLETLHAPLGTDPLPLQQIQQPQVHQAAAQQQQQQFVLPFQLSLPTNQPTAALDTVQQSLEHNPELQVQMGKKKRSTKPKNISDKIHSCTECSYTCNRADKLRVHVKGVHNNDKPFTCTFCGKNFKQRDKVSRHVNTVHYRERPYACDYCPLAFGRKDKVKRHVSTVHLGERPYRCNYCSHNTTRRDKMRIHLQQVHQSIDGSEHYMIDRAPQPPPRILAQNTSRHVSDLVVSQPPTTPAPAAITTAPVPTSQSAPEDVKPALVGLPETIQVPPTSVTTPAQSLALTTQAQMPENPNNLVSLAPVANVVPSLVTSGHMLPNQMLVGEENSQNALNNVVPVRIVTKL